jgi:hypothetical protein
MHIGKIGDYVKAHPWVAGTVVVVGGLLFILISGWFSGGSGSSGGATASSGPSDAQLATSAAVTEANIQGQVASLNSNNALMAAKYAADVQDHQIDAALQLGNLTAGVQTAHDNDAMQLGLSQIAAALQIQTGTLAANQTIQLASITAQQQVQQQSIDAQRAVALHQIDEQQYEVGQQAAIQAQQIQANIVQQQASNDLISNIVQLFKPTEQAPVAATPVDTPAPTPVYTSIYQQGAVEDYLSKNPDVANADYSHESKYKGMSRTQFAIAQYMDYGQREGRQL